MTKSRDFIIASAPQAALADAAALCDFPEADAQAVERRNTNYGSLLACWDRWFGTWRAAEDDETIGVPEYSQAERLNVFTLLRMPFRRVAD